MSVIDFVSTELKFEYFLDEKKENQTAEMIILL